MGVLDFFGREAGQRRRAALDEFGRDIEYYVPPGLRPALGLLAEMTPNRANERAAMASARMFQPDRTVGQRVGDFGEMVSEVAGVVAPVAVAGRAGMPAAEALQEALMGFSAGSQQAGRAVVDRLNQPGPVPTMYSNPLGQGAADVGQPLPAPRNDAEAVARDILEMRAAGRAGNVTDEMMAAADPQYMFANTPLPMDEASRIARARDMGFDTDMPLYHGSASDFPAFDKANRGSATNAMSAKRATWMADSPDVAGGYATFAEGGPIQQLIDSSYRAEADGDFDLADDLMRQAEELEMSGDSAQGGNIQPLMARGKRLAFDADGEKYDANEYVLMDKVNEAQRGGYAGLQVDNFVDNADYSDWTEAAHVGVFDPRNIRSRFARFDPEFRHLRNLSAGVGGLGLLGMSYPPEEQY